MCPRSLYSSMLMARCLQLLRMICLSRLNMQLSCNGVVLLHWRACGTFRQRMVPSVFRPGPLLTEAHTSAHPASRLMRHSPNSIRIRRWTLIVRICGTPSAQPFLHVCPASRGPWHWVRLHRARHAWHPCCLALCFMGSLLKAAPLAGEGVRVTGLRPAPRSFSRSPCGMSPSSRLP